MLKLKMEEYLAYCLNLTPSTSKQYCRQMQGEKNSGKAVVFQKKKLHSDLLKASHRRIKDVISVLNTDGVFQSQLSWKTLHIRLDCTPLGHV